jgi:hypothetical protein
LTELTFSGKQVSSVIPEDAVFTEQQLFRLLAIVQQAERTDLEAVEAERRLLRVIFGADV